jgi:uncharacterized protein YyaL (SSP411 family)
MTPTNHLSTCTSPYLLQHAHNPVDWYPWGEEALRRAREEGKPIFLSIGYSACHWCHVMERESFENPEVAVLLNRDFVSIKVDREERPDLDEIYMGAVQAIAGRGGWPMSVWLTPELEPFYGGTYFPLEARFGFPGFIQLLGSIAEAWRDKRSAVVEDARHLAESLRRQAKVEPGQTLPSGPVFEEVLAQLRRSFDPEWGGFGPAPKFPPFQAVELILRRGSKRDQTMALRTLDAMAEGGIFDHLGGGFARYSVDGHWLVPHFEKMLYDNAELANTYLTAFLATGEARYARVARETLDYLLRDMQDAGGGFYSSEDADSEGEEGRFYTFRPAEVRTLLGDSDGDLFCKAFGIQESGNTEDGKSVLHRFSAPEKLAESCRLSAEALAVKLTALRRQLWEAREQRVHPHKDDKVLTSWNGLALSAMCRGHQILKDGRYREAALACAEFLQRELFKDGVLLRTWRRGQAHTPGFLEDYASVALGLVDLYETTFEARWLRWAEQLMEFMSERFEDVEAGGFYSTEARQQDLILRQKPVFDHSLPSAHALAVQALLRIAHHLDRDDLLASADKALRCFAPVVGKAPRACLGLLEGLELAQQGPLEIVLVGSQQDPRLRALIDQVWSKYLTHRVLALAPGDPGLPLLRGKLPLHDQPTVYVCINRTCLDPVTSWEALEKLLPDRHFSPLVNVMDPPIFGVG